MDGASCRQHTCSWDIILIYYIWSILDPGQNGRAAKRNIFMELCTLQYKHGTMKQGTRIEHVARDLFWLCRNIYYRLSGIHKYKTCLLYNVAAGCKPHGLHSHGCCFASKTMPNAKPILWRWACFKASLIHLICTGKKREFQGAISHRNLSWYGASATALRSSLNQSNNQ